MFNWLKLKIHNAIYDFKTRGMNSEEKVQYLEKQDQKNQLKKDNNLLKNQFRKDRSTNIKRALKEGNVLKAISSGLVTYNKEDQLQKHNQRLSSDDMIL